MKRILRLQSAVLLKNEDGILPLKPDTKNTVLGAMAKCIRYQGAGSSRISPTKLTRSLNLLSNAIYVPSCDERGNTAEILTAEAVENAKNAEIIVVFAGLPARYDSEGCDRDDMKMPEGHLKMIEAVTSVNPNTVVILLCGSAVECPWADSVKGILYMGLPGQAGGEAISDLLYGHVNPC